MLIVGDLNFNVDDLADKEACYFLDFLDSVNMANLEQHIIRSTHNDGQIVVVVISRRSGNLVYFLFNLG